MIYRLIYTGQLKEGVTKESFKEALNCCKRPECIVTLSVILWKERFFLYYESKDDESITPEYLFEGIEKYLEAWPGEPEKRYFIRMYDIFHYNRPVVDEEWMRHQPSFPYAWLMKIKPDMLGSYIFYHQQMQEETPGCGNKYGIICVHENLLLFYIENPDYPNSLCFKGKLNTHNSPKNWPELMNEHFAPWPDTDPPIQWRKDTELIFHFEKIVPMPKLDKLG